MIVFHLYHRTIYTEKTETALQDQSISPGAVALGLLFGRGGPPAVPGGRGVPPFQTEGLNLISSIVISSIVQVVAKTEVANTYFLINQ